MNEDDLTCSVCVGWGISKWIRYSLVFFPIFTLGLTLKLNNFRLFSNNLYEEIFTPPIRLLDICGNEFCHHCIVQCIARENSDDNPDNDVEKIIQEFADSKQIKRREIQKEEILQRCL